MEEVIKERALGVAVNNPTLEGRTLDERRIKMYASLVLDLLYKTSFNGVPNSRDLICRLTTDEKRAVYWHLVREREDYCSNGNRVEAERYRKAAQYFREQIIGLRVVR